MTMTNPVENRGTSTCLLSTQDTAERQETTSPPSI
jgi:hypothetical protein